MTTDTARAIEHLRDALRDMDYASSHLMPRHEGSVLVIAELREEIKRLMAELEGEE
jgi:hypothetical protein